VLDVLVAGPEDGTVLVFHTGTPVGLVPLPPDLDPALLGVRTVLYARPGYARSTPHPGRRVSDAATDTAAILDALKVEQFVNLGWSGGGPHALACQARLGSRCRATAVVAGLAPYTEADPAGPVRSWYESDEDNQMALRGDIDSFRRSCHDFGAVLSHSQADQVTDGARSPADRDYLAHGHAEWVASGIRTAFVSGSHGCADDYLAHFGDWGFRPEDAAGVDIWHGREDANVPLFHGLWLADHLPGAKLRALENEGHISIIGHLFEIINALEAAGR
jgi:pimeloyl-ACP methyl ester carboxylesterase